MKKFICNSVIVIIICALICIGISLIPDVFNHFSKERASKDEVLISDTDIKEEELSLTPVKEPYPGETVLIPVYFLFAIDGDTIYVTDSASAEEGYKVRLIGIDTPESVNADEEKNNEYGTAASDHTDELLRSYKEQVIYLEYDTQRLDNYDRVLAYVWLKDDTNNIKNMLNAQIVDDGYAAIMTIEPNTKYASVFSKMEEDAKETKRGLWFYDGFRELVKEEK